MPAPDMEIVADSASAADVLELAFIALIEDHGLPAQDVIAAIETALQSLGPSASPAVVRAIAVVMNSLAAARSPEDVAAG